MVQLQEQIDKRKDRLATLIQQRQELDQISNRLIVWYDDKQRLITSDTTVPLKTNEIERLQNRYNVRKENSFSIKQNDLLVIGCIERNQTTTNHSRSDYSIERCNQTRLRSRR